MKSERGFSLIVVLMAAVVLLVLVGLVWKGGLLRRNERVAMSPLEVVEVSDLTDQKTMEKELEETVVEFPDEEFSTMLKDAASL